MRTKILLEKTLEALEKQQKMLLKIIEDERKERKELIDRFMSRSLPEFKTYSVDMLPERFEDIPKDALEELAGEMVTEDDIK